MIAIPYEESNAREERLRSWISGQFQLYPRSSSATAALIRLLESGLRSKDDLNRAMGMLGYSVPNLDLFLQYLAQEDHPSVSDGKRAW